ncbi:MAG TPA: DUF131 domain-containing protein [Methanomassiliicoccales archaeon]|nr:DUF131 domain-containing protein [Methanomassiliicoccales archaeon]
MRATRTLGGLLVLAGAALVIVAVILGQMSVGLVLFVIPAVYGSSLLGLLGVALIVLGVFVFFMTGFSEPRDKMPGSHIEADRVDAKKEIGGVILVGPIPIVFGSSSRAATYAIIVAGALITLLLLAMFLLG